MRQPNIPAPTATLSQPSSDGTGAPKSDSDPTLHLPRILCLHGGGTNARIFRAQCRMLRAHLAPSFRLMFVDAPFISPPGPNVEPVYSGWGPFRSWLSLQVLQGQQTHSRLPIDVEAVDRCIDSAVSEDNRAGATGAVVGLLGFSQGAMIAASLLLRQQIQNQNRMQSPSEVNYHFAVLIAGRGPLLRLDTNSDTEFAVDGGQVHVDIDHAAPPELLLRLPTIHVHGLQDPGIEMHRELLHKYCKKGSTRLVEWDGDHRVPTKTKDVAAVVAEMLNIYP